METELVFKSEKRWFCKYHLTKMDETKSNDVNRYERKLRMCNLIAKPMASEKLTYKLLKITKRAAAVKGLKRGIRDVTKAITKKQKGIVIIAGDVSPIDVFSHIPSLCEDEKIPYIYVPSKEDLGKAGATKRPTACVLLIESIVASELTKYYKSIFKKVMQVNERIIHA